jgi:multimeric flavodoxin WrbA
LELAVPYAKRFWRRNKVKAIAINGSPRKNWNTDTICKKVLDGVREAGGETELIQIRDYQFRGCMSCLACHRKENMDCLRCFYQDMISPVLDRCINADILVIGSPIYYGFVTGEVRAFMERLMFPIGTYVEDETGKRVVKLKRKIATAMIYTMNAREEQMVEFGLDKQLEINEIHMRRLFGYCESLYVCDTYQFTDYQEYAVTIFDEKHKAEVKEKQFPEDCRKAIELGRRLVEIALANTQRS